MSTLLIERVTFRYLKEAGVLKPPPAMMTRAWKWVQAQVAADLLADAKDELASPYLSEDKKQTLQTRTRELQQMLIPRIRVKHVKEVRQKMPVDLAGWGYLPRIKSGEGALERIKEQMPFYTLVLTQRTLLGGRANAYWDEKNHVLTVRYPERQFGVLAYGEYYDKGLEMLFGKIAPDLRHEMQHVAQTILTLAFSSVDREKERIDLGKTPPMPGLPSSSIMTPKFMQEMQGLSQRNQRKYKSLLQQVQNLIGEGRSSVGLLHTLDDVEFYTRLGDEIDKFNREYSGTTDPERRKSLLKNWVGAAPPSRSPFGRSSTSSETFAIWKSYAKDKWKKAVKEMAKAVL